MSTTSSLDSTVFVDSNVLVCARDASEPNKQARAEEWMVHLWRSRSGRTSYQVLQEFYVTVTRKLSPGLESEEAWEDVRALMAWCPVAMDGDILEGARLLEKNHGLAWWHATVVATAQACGCRFLLTEQLRHGLVLDGVEVVNPFEHIPETSMIHERA